MRIVAMGAAFACAALLYGCGGGSSNSTGISRYVVTDLGPVASQGSIFINNSSQVVLTSTMAQTVPPTQETYLLSGGTKTDLGTQTLALGINNSGQVLFGNTEYTGGSLQNLSGQFGANFTASAFNTNNQFAGNLVVSNTMTGTQTTHAAIFSNGQFTDLGTLPLFTHLYAVAINDAGQVAGTSITTGGVIHSFIYTGGVLTDLGSLGGDTVQAYGINNAGQVVGSSLLGAPPDSDTHAFLYANGQIKDLGILSGGAYSVAYSINNSGQSVGVATTLERNDPVAVLFTQGKVVNLNNQIPANSRWVLDSATGINDKGLVVGVGAYNGQQHGFMLTPQ